MDLKKLFFVVLLFSSACITVNIKTPVKNREQSKYAGSFESKTLTPANSPVLLPYNRWIEPAGTQIVYGDKRRESHALDVALSPDEKWLAVEGRNEIIIVSVGNGKIVANLPVSMCVNNPSVKNTFSGICWHQEGDVYRLWWGAVDNTIRSFILTAAWDNKNLIPGEVIPFDAVKPANIAIPNEVLVEKESGRLFLYIVLNGNNSVVKVDADTKEKIWTSQVGVAPFGIAKANGKIYVTNWAGALPAANDPDVAGTPWGSAKVDHRTGATREGTVSVLDPGTGKALKEIPVGLHPNDVVASPDGKFVFVANANSDEVSAISTTTDQVTETISVRLSPDKNSFWGDSPNGLAISDQGDMLYVANGMDNAVAVVSLGKESSFPAGEISSTVKGFIPTGAYPGGLALSGKNQLFVANIEAGGAYIPSETDIVGTPSYNSHRMTASVSVISLPDDKELKALTKKVEESNQHFRLELLAKLPRKNVQPVPVPARIGEPSVFKHVLYIIKENRTYDQVLGDMKKGDGDSTLTIFGKQITPNTHQLCDEFILLDNFYVSGKCSAEGHQWTDASIVNDYIEKNVQAWIRSYPHIQKDALVYAPTGFIWDNALKNGKKVRIYGEASFPVADSSRSWTSVYQKYLRNEKPVFKNKTSIKTIETIQSPDYPGYGGQVYPDVLRADVFIRELKHYEEMENDQLPELMVMALPNDHTSGTRPGLPTPRAMVADNDLALGRIVEAVSKSRFWSNTVIFVTEDDSQGGWDHVSAYRTVGMVLSPWSRTGGIVHTNYNQPSMIRTMEQILGMPPMNIMDATAMPMFDCFTREPDMTPYVALNNVIPLNEMNPPLNSLTGKARYYAEKNLEPQFDGIDTGDDDLFNHILWFAMKGKQKYPGKYSGKDEDE